ncbi:MAG TPA: c-type cytochrome [Gemmataceae bacterium]|jgi:putative heme-binding domain-containing protein|nr:c-type cytochrome [Gemmataceae bacterium]
MSRRVAVFLAFVSLQAFAAEPAVIAPTGPKTPAEELASFKLPPGFKAQLVASEPDILKPMQIAFDAKGRLWVPTSREYPFAAIGRPGTDKLFVLEDFGPDGKARKVSVFADDLNIPIGILPLPDCKSVIVSSIDPGPDGAKQSPGVFIWKLTDTKGTGKYDLKEKLYGPFGIRDTHGMVNSFTLMPDGWVYACHGFSNEDKVKGADGHEAPMQSGSVFRFRPDGRRIEVFTRGEVNPFGMTYDSYFNLYDADCHSKPITQLIRGAVYESFGKPHDGLGFGPNMINHDHGSTALCGLAWYEADQFPKEFKGTMFLGNVVTNRINFDKIEFVGSTPMANQQPDFLVSEDLWFRPVDIKLGPDGCLYVSDFYNKIIGHYEVDLRHPGRDKTRGRIWRIVWTGKDAKEPKSVGDITGLKREALEKLLGDANIMVRMQATHQLINRKEAVLQEARKVEDESDVRRVHEMWANEAEPLFDKMDHKLEALATPQDNDGLIGTHRYRLQSAQAEWRRDHRGDREEVIEKAVQEIAKDADHPQVARAKADWMTTDPKPANLPELLKAIEKVKPEDTHLRHSLRIALRETLRDPAAFTALKAIKLKGALQRAVADVLLGLPTKDAADYLTANLANLPDPKMLPTYIEHASRFGDGAKPIFQFVTTHKPDDLRQTVAMFAAYQRGLQQKGGPRFDKDDTDFAEGLLGRGLKDVDGQVVQSCLDLATALKLKSAADGVRDFAMQKDRPDAQRGAAFATFLAVDPVRAGPIVGKVLTDADERIEVRERAAQALAGAASPATYAELTGALEKAPARLQTSIAIAMAGQAAGADHLLKTVAAGKASARLLQERAVQARLNESKLPKVGERIAELTKGLPSADQKMTALMNQRRTAFAKAKVDPKAGALIYKNNCANCHQLGGEGAKVGPQLDGLGVRGLDRLLEDIFDPSRNVDQAFRATVLNLKDGKQMTGLVLREEGALIVMADNLGKEVRIPKADVDERRVSLLSPMPANFNETIKEEDFYNLMAFLLQQRPKDK